MTQILCHTSKTWIFSQTSVASHSDAVTLEAQLPGGFHVITFVDQERYVLLSAGWCQQASPSPTSLNSATAGFCNVHCMGGVPYLNKSRECSKVRRNANSGWAAGTLCGDRACQVLKRVECSNVRKRRWRLPKPCDCCRERRWWLPKCVTVVENGVDVIYIYM